MSNSSSSPGGSATETPGRLIPSVVEAMLCPVAVVGLDGAILGANAAWDRMAQPTGSSGAAARSLGDLFADAADTAEGVRCGGGAVSRRGLALASGPGGAATWWDLDLVAHPDAPEKVLVTAREVTDHVLARRDAEDARAALEPIATRLRLAQDAAGIGTWEWDVAADRQAWSPQQFRLYGLNPETDAPPSYEGWNAMVHPDDRATIQAGGEADRGFQTEFRIRRADSGAERWLMSLGRVMDMAANGLPRRILGVNIDITDRQNREAALRESEAMLRLASDAAGIYAWNWDLGTDRVTWSEGLEQALGLPPGGFGGTVDAFRALLHPDDAPEVEVALGRALAGETAEYRATFRMFRADGSIRWTETRGRVFRDEHGRSVRVAGMDYDITERKAAEAALLERKARLRLFTERAPAAIAMFDTDMRYIAVSHRFIADYGLHCRSPAELIDRCHYEVFPDLPPAWRDIHRCVLAGETHSAED